MAEGPKQTVNHIFFLYIVTFNLFFRQLTLMLGAYLCMCVCVLVHVCVLFFIVIPLQIHTSMGENNQKSSFAFQLYRVTFKIRVHVVMQPVQICFNQSPRTGFLRAMFIIEAVLMKDFFHHPSLYSSLPSILLSTHPSSLALLFVIAYELQFRIPLLCVSCPSEPQNKGNMSKK